MLQQGQKQGKIPKSKGFNECLIEPTVDSDQDPDHQCLALATGKPPSVRYCPLFLTKPVVVTGNKGARPFPPCLAEVQALENLHR